MPLSPRGDPAVVIDRGTPKGARADERLREDKVAWLITVSPESTPVPTPVWFWWDGTSLIVYSQRDKPKLRHIAANPRVALALRTDETGDEITVVTGEAAVDPSLPAAHEVPEYVAKYGELIAGMGSAPEPFAAEYSVPIRITPTRLRQWPGGDPA